MKRIAATLLVALALAAGIAVVTVQVLAARSYADVPLPEVRSSTDPVVIERGAYLVNAVAHCPACHLPQGEAKSYGPLSRPQLVGGHRWDLPYGTVYSANITPSMRFGIGAWTDGEVARVIRTGVRRDGSLSPFMVLGVGDIADDDLSAIVSYLRAQAPVDRAAPQSEYNFAGRAALAFFLRPKQGRPALADAPRSEASIERGRYLVHGPANCAGCHSPAALTTGLWPQAPLLSGGIPAFDEDEPGMETVAPNLTPDPATGVIYHWSEDDFVGRFRGGRVVPGSPMPWEAFFAMTDTDLAAIWRYLRTVEPIRHEVGPTHRAVGANP